MLLGRLQLVVPLLHVRNRMRRVRARVSGRTARAVQERAARGDISTPRYVTTVSRGRRIAARHRWNRRIIDIMGDNRELVIGLAEVAGVRYSVVPVDRDDRHRVAIAASDRAAFVEALADAAEGVYVCVDDVGGRSRRRPVRAADLRRRARSRPVRNADAWRIFEYYLDDRGGLAADAYGCEVEFWSESTDEEAEDWLEAVRWNPTADRVGRSQFGSTMTAPSSAGVRATPGTFEHPDITTVGFPIDVVFTWVDGDDPAWLERKQRALSAHGSPEDLNPEAASRSRYSSRDELRYALRSLEQCADFVRRVYIVTDSQRPCWLVDDHPRMRLVDHKEIIPSDVLPVFNSHAIEAHLHLIPGLSEHYLYLNDDFFFMRRMRADRFFHANGVAKFFLSRAQIPLGEVTELTKPVNAAAMNGRSLLQREFDLLATRKFKHAPYPQLRSVHAEMRDRFPTEVERTASSRFRSPTDVALASSLHHYVAYALGRAVPGSISSRYVDLGSDNLESRLYDLRRVRDVDVLCLNDSDSSELDPQAQTELTTRFLEERFPVKSTFER